MRSTLWESLLQWISKDNRNFSPENILKIEPFLYEKYKQQARDKRGITGSSGLG
jgi:hypothetical protein